MIRIGMDIGGTGIQMGIVNEQGTILAKDGVVTRTDIPFEEQISQMAACALNLMDKNGYTLQDLASVGAGVPGVADQRTGIIPKCVNLGWENVPFREEMSKHFGGRPVFIDNDATVAGLAESVAGVSAGTSSSVFITLGTGVGGGIIINGRVWNGAHGIGSEIGHMTLELDGEPCTCGNKGCLERYCSATAIIRQARQLLQFHPESLMMDMCKGDLSAVNARLVFDAAKEQDPCAVKVFRRYVTCLAQAINTITAILDPEMIVLGGGVSKSGNFLLDAVREEVPKYALFKDAFPLPRIEIARLGTDAGIIGAAMLH